MTDHWCVCGFYSGDAHQFWSHIRSNRDHYSVKKDEWRRIIDDTVHGLSDARQEAISEI